MARRRIKRSSLFTLVAVVALLSLGIGYAAWTSNLYLSSTLSTASMNVYWSDATAEDSSFEGCALEVRDSDSRVLDLEIIDGYPGVECTFEATAFNDSPFAVMINAEPAVSYHPDGFIPTPADCDGDFELAEGGVLDAGESSTCTWTVTLDGTVAQNLDVQTVVTFDFVQVTN